MLLTTTRCKLLIGAVVALSLGALESTPASRVAAALRETEHPDHAFLVVALERKAASIASITCSTGLESHEPQVDSILLERSTSTDRKSVRQQVLTTRDDAEAGASISRSVRRRNRDPPIFDPTSLPATGAPASSITGPPVVQSTDSRPPPGSADARGAPTLNTLDKLDCSCEDYDCTCDRTCSCRLLGDGGVRIAKNASSRVLPATAVSAAVAQADTSISYLFHCGCGFSVESDSSAFTSMDCQCEQPKGQGCKCQRRCTCSSSAVDGARIAAPLSQSG